MEKKKGARIRFVSWLAAAVLLTCILIMGITGFPFGGGRVSFGFGVGYTYPNADKYKVGDFTLKEEISQLEINWTAGNVTVKVGDGNEVYAEETKVSDDDRKMRYLVENGKLTIQFQKSKWSLFSIRGSSENKDLTVCIPKRMAENMESIDIETVSANIELGSFDSREMDIETVSGKINMSGLSAKILDLESVSGNIGGTEVQAEKLDAETVSGDVDIDGSFGAVDLEAVSGNLSITSDVFIREADAETVSGRIMLKIPEGDGFTAELDSVSGDFNTDFAVKTKDGEKIYGDGSAEYSFETVSGDVYVNRKK